LLKRVTVAENPRNLKTLSESAFISIQKIAFKVNELEINQ